MPESPKCSDVTKMQLPHCPNCGKPLTLILWLDMTIACAPGSGGCGMEYSIDDLPKFYREEVH